MGAHDHCQAEFLGYKQSKADPRAFSKREGHRYIMMCIHVDDFFVVSSEVSWLHQLKRELEEEYGSVSSQSNDLLGYLGMQIRTHGSYVRESHCVSARLCQAFM